MSLKYYAKEQEYFKDEYDKELDDFDTRVVFDKLKAHYKINQCLGFRGNTNGHCRRFEIVVPHDCPLGLLVHEVSHAIQLKKGKTEDQRWHTKKHFNIMKKVMKYTNAHKDEWIANADKKIEQKMQTIERQEKKAEELEQYKKTPEYKLQKVKERIKQWESKRKRAESCLKKLYRKKKYYESHSLKVSGEIKEEII